jgi:hypothetical protein
VREREKEKERKRSKDRFVEKRQNVRVKRKKERGSKYLMTDKDRKEIENNYQELQPERDNGRGRYRE